MPFEAHLLVFGLILLTVVLAVRRLRDIRGLSAWVWLVLAVSAALPAWVGSQVLREGVPIASARIARLHEKATLEVPAGHALLVHGVLAPTEGMNDRQLAEAGRTNYRLALSGTGWTQQATGEIRRKADGGGDGVAVDGGASIGEGRRGQGRWGEELEQRFELVGHGTVELELALWQGAAASALVVDVVRGPPPRLPLIVAAVILAVLGLVAELRAQATQVSGDVAFLASFSVFLRDRVTLADGFKEAAGAGLGAALVGWGAVAGLAWVILKAQERASKGRAPAP